MASDLRYAIRRWIDRPLFATAVVLTLALGIGSTVSVFSVVDAVLLRPLPYTDPDRLVTVSVARPHWRTDPVLSMSWDTGNLSWPILGRLQQARDTFDAFGSYSMPRMMLEGERAEIVQAMQVSASFLPMLGVQPATGRFFAETEDTVPTDAALISAEAWRRRFGGAADIVGRRVTLESTARTIVGVVPDGFTWPASAAPEFFIPFGTLPASNRSEGNHFMQGVGRLKPEISLAQSQAATAPLVTGTESPDRKTSAVRSLAESRRGDARRPLLLLLAAALSLLLIASSNVAGLLLAETMSRRHETAVRLALGASRLRLGRQFFAESLVLGAVASVLGLVLASWAIRGLLALAPSTLPGMEAAGVNGRLLFVAVALMMAVTVVFGVSPVLANRALSPARAIREGAWGSGQRWSRSQRAVVTLQIGLATLLLITAGLLGETLLRLQSVPVGFQAGNLAMASVRYPAAPVVPAPQRPARTDAILTALSAVPGVTHVAAVSTAPFSGGSGSSSITIEGQTGDRDPTAFRQVVTDGYFETMRIPIMKGRAFMSSDAPGAYAAVVTAEFERRLLGGHGVGKRFTLNGNVHEVVGVAGDTKHRRYREDPGPMFYILHRQVPNWPIATFVVRTAGEPEAIVGTLRETLQHHDPRMALTAVESLSASMSRSVAEEQYRATLTVAFAFAAVLLAGIGLYGLIARSVSLRVREFGVRAALGATPGAMLRLVLGEGLQLTALGLALGLGAALITGRFIETLLFEVRTTAPHTLILAVVGLGSVALFAAAVPAYRACRIDPALALRDR